MARAVAEGWGGDFTEVDLMGHPSQKWYKSDDVCLFAVPVYSGRVPPVVIEWLQELVGNGAKAVLIAVFGNRAIDDALVELVDELQRAGFRGVAAIEAVAQHSLLPKYGAGRPDARDIEELKDYGRQIREAMEADKLSEPLLLPGNHPYKKYKDVPLKPIAVGCCIACGNCEKQCPVGAIPSFNMARTDVDKCISCMRCIQVCPVHVRKLSKSVVLAATVLMKKSCSAPKPNKLYL